MSERKVFGPPDEIASEQASMTMGRLRPRRSVSVSPWFFKFIERLAALRELQPGWDSKHATPPSVRIIQDVHRFVNSIQGETKLEPSVVPTFGGGLQVEWHSNGHDIEIEFSLHDSPTAYVARKDGSEVEGDAIELWGVILETLRELTSE